LRTVISDAIQHRLSDPRIERLTSVTRVEVSPDLATARVYVSVMGNEVRRKLCMEALEHAAGRLRALLARRTTLRRVARLEFCLDNSVQRAFETVQMIDAAMAELGQRLPWETEEAPIAPAAGSTPPVQSDPGAPAEDRPGSVGQEGS
jgi:ribosome-binding factor A